MGRAVQRDDVTDLLANVLLTGHSLSTELRVLESAGTSGAAVPKHRWRDLYYRALWSSLPR